MATNYITITYKGLPLNIKCKNRILEGGNVYAYFNNTDELEDAINIFNNFGINHGTINTPKTIGIVASAKDLIVGDENDIKDDDELYKSIDFIRTTENRVRNLHERISNDLGLIKTIIDDINELQDSAVVDNAINIEKALNLIRENIKHLERRMFFAKPDVNKKVLLSSRFNLYDFQTIVYIHVFMKNSDDVPNELKFFANIGCYTDEDIINKIKNIDPIVIKLIMSMFNEFSKVKPEALEEANKLILEWWQ